MSWTIRTVALLSLLVASFGTVARADLLIGDTFSGSFNLDPNAPMLFFSANNIYSYEGLPPASPLGTISLSFANETFSSPILVVSNSPHPQGPFLWVLQASGPTTALIIFSGPTQSTSIFPLNLDAYSRNDFRYGTFVDGINIQIAATLGDQRILLGGEITSLIRSDEEGSFSFTGGIVSISPFVAGIPEPSTWAMLLIGFAGIGFAVYRRQRNTALIAA